jgi:hypothetical protein
LLKSCPLGLGGDTIGKTVFTLAIVCIGKYFGNIFLNSNWTQRAEIYIKVLCHSTKENLLKSWSLGIGSQGLVFRIVEIQKNI